MAQTSLPTAYLADPFLNPANYAKNISSSPAVTLQSGQGSNFSSTPATPNFSGNPAANDAMSAIANAPVTQTPQSVWNNPAVSNNAVTAKNEQNAPIPAGGNLSNGVLPSGTNGSTQNGAAITPADTGAQPFQGDYTFDANGNVTGIAPSTTQQGSNPNPAANQTANPASNIAAQTNAILQSLQGTGAQGSAGDAPEQELESQIQNLQTNYGTQLGDITGSETPEAFETGAANVLSSQYAPQLSALTNQLASLQSNRAASIGASESAGGIANNLQSLEQQNEAISPGQSLLNLYSGKTTGSESPLPITLNPAQTLISPYTGQSVASGGGSQSVQSLAQHVASGQMGIEQAQSFLPDQALSPQLQQAVSAINPSYNFQQSATNQNTQGQIAPAAANATAQIQNLGSALSSVPGLENTSIPIVNSFTRLATSLLGGDSGSATGLESARQDAISAVQGALETANGMTPSQAGSLADSYFPPGLTSAQFQNGVTQFQNQIAGKESAFSNPGSISSTAGQGTVSAGGYNFVQNAQGQWVAQ